MEPVTIFDAYPFTPGEKIHIKNSPRSGDWEVKEVTDTKVTLKCPVSGRELTWSRFCYFVEKKAQKWPDED